MQVDYTKHLNQAIDSLFRNVQDSGFWSDSESRIIFRLDMDNADISNLSWNPNLKLEYRYGPYALMGALYWRLKDKNPRLDYDKQMIAYSIFLSSKIDSNGSLVGDSSGLNHSLVLNCLTLSSLIFPEVRENFLEKLFSLYEFTTKTWPVGNIQSNQSYVLLYSYCHFYKLLKEVKEDKLSNKVLNEIKTFIRFMSSIQTNIGAFNSGDPRYIYHQRMFLPLWGYFKGLGLLKEQISAEEWESLLSSGVKGIQFACNKRMLANGELYWHEYFWKYKNNSSIFGQSLKFNPNKNLFYEVHQCLFAVALSEYKKLTNDSRFEVYRERALNWIFANNKLGEGFIDYTNLGIPFRVMTSKGSVFFKGNKFKGSYEVGIYIMALVDFVKQNKQ